MRIIGWSGTESSYKLKKTLLIVNLKFIVINSQAYRKSLAIGNELAPPRADCPVHGIR